MKKKKGKEQGMALLTLKNIGKIYASDGNIAVGIRGVDLSFERGEFVAVTGKSGSGKSTLLNVISGMDTYEEGELIIEGQPTSHYLQADWEEYRQKYISFIFQDYNIIESFTVLQNVELALMHIADKKERRRRAMELLERVGLSSHVRQKGSRLSGGQKQRTVIARALAKDSPIILADEPTGNLDSVSSAEIIALLREVSRDKLLIVVTHNFEEVEAAATRHIRIYDGAVESDHVICRPARSAEKAPDIKVPDKRTDFRNGLTLGRSIFTSKPRLSIFLCLLMIIGSLGVFGVTTLCGGAAELFADYEMFTPIEGRVVLTRQNGAPITDEELASLASEYGAEESLHYDTLLDGASGQHLFYRADRTIYGMRVKSVYGEHYGEDIIGSYPTADDEVFLYLPIGKQPQFGVDELKIREIDFQDVTLRVSGVKYFYDNNRPAKILFTSEGFRLMTAVYYLGNYNSSGMSLNVILSEDGKQVTSPFLYNGLHTSFGVEQGKLYISGAEYRKYLSAHSNRDFDVTVDFTTYYNRFNYDYGSTSKNYVFSERFTEGQITDTAPESLDGVGSTDIVISPYLLRDVAEKVLAASYRQASLFFADNETAYAAAERLCDAGYIAVPADTTYTPSIDETLGAMITAIATAAVWLLAILFLAFFLNLCSTRTLSAFKGDMAIMRSMGIPVKVIRTGMYVRMLIALIPAYITVIAAAVVIFTTPQLNPCCTFLYPWQYALIFAGMLLLTLRLTHKQIAKLFGESVKKSLRGGKTE